MNIITPRQRFVHSATRIHSFRIAYMAERYQLTSSRQSADVFNDGSQSSDPNARQDIRHLRIRCDAGRLASMGRAELES